MECDGEKVQWLRTIYREADEADITPCPSPKRVKLADIHEHLKQKYAPTTFSHHRVSQIVSAAFPNAESRIAGKTRTKHVFGIEPLSQPDFQEGSSCSQPEVSASEERNPTSLAVMLDEERKKNQQLMDRLLHLEERMQLLEQTSPDNLAQQADAVVHHGGHIANGPDTPDHFRDFSLDKMILELQKLAPDAYKMFMQLGNVHRHLQHDSESPTTEEVKAVTSLCTLLNARSSRVKGMQLLLSMMLIARSTNKQALTVLNHAGICMSYYSTWQYLRLLTAQAQYSELVKTGHWIWVYDNLNMHQRVRHERAEHHSSMRNFTARIAVRIQNLPEWDVDWSDDRPQKRRSDLTGVDFLATENDAKEIQTRAVQYMMEVLVAEFSSLSDLKHLVPARQSPHPVQKSFVVPMKVLFKDEKYTSETIEILTALMKDAQLTGTPQAIVGDQLTCKIIRGSKQWRISEIEPKDRLSWAHENPGDFHFLWECLRVIFAIFWGTPNQPGSLCNIREYINRNQVDKGVKVFNVGDEFLLHAFKGHLIASVCKQLKLISPEDPIDHEVTLAWLETTALDLVLKILYPVASTDPVYRLHRSFMHFAFLYSDLRTSIRWEDGPHIIRHWKLWIPYFLATGKKNYATEAGNLIANVIADFPAHIAYIVCNNRTDGSPGHGKPIDQLIEHYNLVMKQTLQSCGPNATTSHIEEVSLSALFLLEAAKKADRVFHVTPQSRQHTVRDATSDVRKVADHLIEQTVTVEMPNRTAPPFIDPTDKGFEKLASSAWIDGILSKSLVEEEITEERDEVDLNYELYDVP